MVITRKVYGVGVVGKGKYNAGAGVKSKHSKQYSVWSSMLKRCYDPKEHEKNPSYKDCKVVEEWLSLQVFGEWFDKNYKEGYQLDKDLLLKGNKIYGPETCCFVPQEINLLLVNNKRSRGVYPIGVSKQRNKYSAHVRVKNKQKHLGNYDTPESAYLAYKIAKEKDIRSRAEEYKDKVCDKAYVALLNYKIEKQD